MPKSLSMDLRDRLISAVDGGMSRRSAAKLFSVAPSTAIKWVDQQRRTGNVWPRARGGDHRSHHLEAHADEIVTLAKDTDLTLAELVGHSGGGPFSVNAVYHFANRNMPVTVACFTDSSEERRAEFEAARLAKRE